MKTYTTAMLRPALLASAAAVSLAAPTFAHAQSAPPAGQGVNVSEIVVTGSRIRRDTFDAPLPLATISSDQIRQSGHVILGDALMEIPMVAANSNAQNTSNSLFNSGQARVDIRGLGASRTLVLMDGRRIVNSDASSPAVDLNTIPSLMIDRVEVQPGGVSAVYGSEAIAGVVNLIMKKSFDGFQADAQAGQTYKSDGQQYILGAMWGRHFMDDRLSVVVGGEYGREDPVFQRDRSQLFPGIRRDNTATPQTIVPASRSTTSPFATFQFPTSSARPGGVTIDVRDPTQIVALSAACSPAVILPSCQDPSLFYSQVFNVLQNRTTRGAIRSYLEFKITDHVKAFADLSYARVIGYGWFQPAFSSTQGGGLIPATVKGDNAFLNTSQTTAAQDLRAFWVQAFGAGGFTSSKSVNVGKFWQEFGGRDSQTRRSVQRYVLGMEGDLDVPFIQNFHWDWYAEEGRLKGHTINFNVPNDPALVAALDAVVNPANGQIVCRSTLTNPTNGCVPWDVINGPSRAAVLAVNANATTASTGKQDVVALNLTFDAIKLPAGPLGVAVGAEYRKEQSLFTQDPLSASGVLFFNAIGTRGGSYNVKEAYAEVRVPILKDLPFAREFTIEGAVRDSNYSTIHETRQWRVASEWAPFSDIRFRGSVASAVRAPNIVELFSPQSRNFTTAAQDPCDKDAFRVATAGQQAARRITCAAAIPGWNPLTFISNIGPGRPSLALLQGGNPNLGPETAETWDLGVVVRPHWVPGLNLSLDFFKYNIKNEVGTIPINTLFQNLCFDAPTPFASNPFCRNIQRDPTGTNGGSVPGGVIQAILTNQNVASVKIEGFDFSAAYGFDVGDVFRGHDDWGRIGLRVDGTDMYNWALQGLPGQAYTQFANTINNATPRWKATGTVDWTNDKLLVGWTTHFIGSMIANNGLPITALNPAKTGNYYEHDLRGRYRLNDQVEVRAGVLNITNKYPPYLPETFDGRASTGASIFSNIGRFYYVGATLRY